MTMLGRWSDAHRLQEPAPCGDTSSYELAADWLRDCSLVEDWGCGLGWAKRYFKDGTWRGIDGSTSPLVHEIVDLTNYQTRVPGILMRHVLEHNVEWEKVLDNALESFTERMVLIIFTPFMDQTQTIAWNPTYQVPDISFLDQDIEERFPSSVSWTVEDLRTKTQYGCERVYYLEVVHGQETKEWAQAEARLR